MEKPFDLIVQETREKINAVLNESKLPVSVCAMLINEVRNNVSIELAQYMQYQKQSYEEALKKESEKSGSKDA